MTEIESKLSDWTAEQIALTLEDTPKGKKSGNEYLVWALDLPQKYEKDETLRATVEKIQKATAKLEKQLKKGKAKNVQKASKTNRTKADRARTTKEVKAKRPARRGSSKAVNKRSKGSN